MQFILVHISAELFTFSAMILLKLILNLFEGLHGKCDPQDFNAKGESTRTTRFLFKTKEFILTRFSTLTILPH